MYKNLDRKQIERFKDDKMIVELSKLIADSQKNDPELLQCLHAYKSWVRDIMSGELELTVDKAYCITPILYAFEKKGFNVEKEMDFLYPIYEKEMTERVYKVLGIKL